MPDSKGRRGPNPWIALFSVWALHGLIALWQIMSLPLSSQSFLLGLSLSRFLIISVTVLWVVLSLTLLVFVARGTTQWTGLLDWIRRPVARDALLISAILVVLFRVGVAILMSLFAGDLLKYVAYIDRLLPVFDLFTYVSLEVIVLILLYNFSEREGGKKISSSFVSKLVVILMALGSVSAIISLTGLGIAPNYQGDWARGLPAVPLLEWQIILACILCVGMVIVEANQRIFKFPRLDLWIALAVWSIAVMLWLAHPIVPNTSALGPCAPNFEVYPFNDAQTYDEFAQSVLIGNGFVGIDSIPPRPLYIVLLAFMHVLVGQDYGNMITLQSMLFGMFPVLLYLFGREFFGRPIGISIAFLAILRDYTSNLVSPFTGNLTYSKLYLSEIPTAMLLILFLLVGLRWIKSGLPVYSGFLLGGILGVAMLIRAQVVMAFPMLLLFAFAAQPGKIVLIIKNALLALITIIIVICPWLWRNWRLTGELVFENPVSQMANLALRYNRLNGVAVDNMPLPGETSSDYNTRLTELATDAIDSNPFGIIRAIVNSFLNHAVNNILVFPLRNTLRDFGELWTPTNAFWEGWEGTPTLPQGLLLASYILLFGLGLSVAWQRNGWLGFLPLGVNLIYNLSTSLALISGERFMLTMDWSIYLYYTIGLFALLSVFLLTLESGRSMILKWYEANTLSFMQHVDQKKVLQYIFAGILFLGIGASLPLSEMIFPQKYPQVLRDDVLNKAGFSSALKQSKLDATCFENIVKENQLSIIQGRAVYPRFYEAGAGETFTDSAGYKTVDEGRLVFQMIGQINQRVIFPMSVPPDFFPNASDATLFIDSSGTTWFIFVEQGDVQRMYFSEALVSPICN